MKRNLGGRVWGRLKERNDEPAPRLTLRAVDAAEAPPPIFIIGAQRSGTSLVRRILDSHSGIACPPESKFILPLTAVMRDRKALSGWDSMGYGRDEVFASLAGFIREFFDGYAEAQGKRRWAEKTPNYVDCLPELWDLFGPRVQFLIILRHGMDVAFSLADPHRHYPAVDEFLEPAGGSLPVAGGLFWADKNHTIETFRAQHPESCHRFRFEDLTLDPEGTLRPLFEWLGERWEPEVVDYGSFPHHAGYGDPDVKRRKRVEPNSGRYRSWPQELQASVREACGPLLSSFGYG